MAEEELIDSIVSNESLGIKRKPSVFKILAVGGIIAVFGSLAYSFYNDNKNSEEKPPLELDGFNSMQTANDTVAVESNPALNEVEKQKANTSKPDITEVAISSTTEAESQNTPSNTSPVSLEQNNPEVIGTTKLSNQTSDRPPAQEDKSLALTTNEKLVEEPIADKKPVVKKPVVKKWTKKKVNKEPKEAQPIEVITPTLIEEGVSQEEIIVFR